MKILEYSVAAVLVTCLTMFMLAPIVDSVGVQVQQIIEVLPQ